MALLKKSDYAAHRGVSPAAITKHLKSGRLQPALVRDADGKERIDSEIADSIIAQTLDTAKQRGRGFKKLASTPSGDGSGDPPNNALDDIRRKQAQAKLEEQLLDLAQRKAETLPRAAVVSAITTACGLIMETLQSRNHKIATQTSTMTNVIEIAALLDAEDRALLELLNHEFSRSFDPQGTGSGFSIN